MRTLTIDDSVLYKEKIESYEEMKNSFFAPEYLEASRELLNIVNTKGNGANNIIAFTGERGSGKTSSMISFSNAVCSNSCNCQYDKESDLDNAFEEISKYKWNTLDVIDPSVLTENDSVLEVIIGNLFKKFKEFNQKSNNIEFNLKQNLVKNFERVYKELSSINNSSRYNRNSDNLERLLDLSCAVDLRNSMTKLVQSYLDYMNRGESKNSYLVISIDDIDMNLSQGMDMLEEIRKYLMIHKVVILLAVKISQLEEVITQKHIKELLTYKDSYLYSDTEKEAFYNEIHNKTEKYLEKILPYARRINLPSINDVRCKTIFKESFREFGSNNVEDFDSLKLIIQKQFFDKLGYMITTDKHYRSIMPKTLRGYIQLFNFLKVMYSASYHDENRNSIIADNLLNYKDYLVNILINEVSNFNDRSILVEILNCHIGEMKRKAFLYINNKLYDRLGTLSNEGLQKNYVDLIKDIKEINSRSRLVKEKNLSLGHLVSWIKLYEITSNSQHEERFGEMFKLVLAVRLLCEYMKNNAVYSIIKDDLFGRYLEVKNVKGYKHYNKEVKKESAGKEYLGFLDHNPAEDDEEYKDEFKINSENKYYYDGSSFDKMLDDFDNLSDELRKYIYNMKIFFTIFEPKYTSYENLRNEVIYRDDIDTYELDDCYEVSNLRYIFKPLKAIGCNISIYHRKSMLEVVNLDFFMNVLDSFADKVNKKRYNQSDFIKYLYYIFIFSNQSFYKCFNENKEEFIDSVLIRDSSKAQEEKQVLSNEIMPRIGEMYIDVNTFIYNNMYLMISSDISKEVNKLINVVKSKLESQEEVLVEYVRNLKNTTLNQINNFIKNNSELTRYEEVITKLEGYKLKLRELGPITNRTSEDKLVRKKEDLVAICNDMIGDLIASEAED